MAEASTRTGWNLGFLDLLGVLFIGLKLASIITWSWWFVLLPIYAPLLVVVGVYLVAFVVLFTSRLFGK